MIDKTDCEHFLASRALRAAEWRAAQALKFPDDKRNAKAAERLRTLATEVTIPDAAWPDIAGFYNEASSRWLEAVSVTNRQIGFHRHPRNGTEYLRNLLSNLH